MKKTILGIILISFQLLFFTLIFLVAFKANAQDTLPVDQNSILASVTTFFESLLEKYPNFSRWFGIAISTLGACRLIFKPIFSLLEKITPTTQTKVDDKLLSFMQKLGSNKYLHFVIDWLFSIKLPKRAIA